MNYDWSHIPPSEAETKLAGEMAAELKISPVLARVLIKRGVESVQDARKFFRPQLTDLHDPFLFQDMQKAVDRLNEALGRKERILVYGDYDVDGCTAVALVYRFLQQFYSNLDYYIPDRN
jgi:single-stranded-DNA-specific exonuclease